MTQSTLGATPPPMRRVEEILRRLEEGGLAAVALSGGVDSSVVAQLAFKALGPRAKAVTLAGPAVSPSEVERATRVAAWIGIGHEVLTVDPLSRLEYRQNAASRCYYCRQGEGSAIRAWGEVRHVRQYLDGLHVDDLGDSRPGIRAMDEAGFDHPLVRAGWGKSRIREYARSVGLPNWDQPSDACLASRVHHGAEITGELLDRVRQAEEWLLSRGFRRVRVRTDGRSARVVVDPAEVPRLRAEPLASDAVSAIGALGFSPVELDPAGYAKRPNG